MLEIIILVAAVYMLSRQMKAFGGGAVASAAALAPAKVNPQVARLAEYADRLYVEKKWLAAEKAYLNVLKVDHKNVTAYSHLGVIYSTQKNFSDAIECFQIAVRLRPGGGTFQNLGLAFYENRNYMKSIAAFEKAIMFESTAQRHIGLSKSYRKIGNQAKVLQSLERAAELDPSKRVLQLLADVYEEAERKTDAIAIYRRIHQLDPHDADAARKIGIHLPDQSPAKA